MDKAVGFTNNYVGYDFFNDACVFISKALDIKYALIGKFAISSYHEVQTLSLVKDGEVLPAYTYTLKNTPCENVLFNRICFYPDNVQKHFPSDKELQVLDVHSYMGISLADTEDNRLGLLVLMDEKPFRNPALAEEFITILSPRVEEEVLRST